MIKVISRRDESMFIDTEYVGRPGPLGNPFILGQDGTREQVIAKYRTWLQALWFDDCGPNPQKTELTRLIDLYKDKGTLTLVCWCAPKACHGDVIREAIIHEAI